MSSPSSIVVCIGPSFSLGLMRALAAGAILCGAGCTEYLNRRDTLTLESGEAVQNNVAVHVIDPAPPAASRIERYANGERLQHAIERYRNPQVGFGAFGGAPSVPVGPSASPSAGIPLSR